MSIRLLRVDVSLRVIFAWGAALLFPGLLFGSILIVLAALSIPLLFLAAIVALWFGGSIARNPMLWSAAAIFGALIVGCAIYGRAGLLSLVISMPAALFFWMSLRLFPLQQSQA
ncbi:hypothetical protein BRX37_05255 [Sphingomonas sp. S-NIH.Pt3_0716]|jgi:hypothetical protein|nr:hypothetical protein BRX37_05255 [Sphingomonas sp. S-NIH.Pt3_0716]